MKRLNQNGSVILEMSVMMPVMVLLTLVSIQFTILINAYVSVKNVSGVIAKYAILTDPKPTDDQVLNFADELIEQQTLDVSKFEATALENVVVGSLTAKKISLQYNAPIIVPLPGWDGEASFPIKVSTVMW